MTSQPSRNPLTVEEIREIVRINGFDYAEKCITEDERQFGAEALAAARQELEDLIDLAHFA